MTIRNLDALLRPRSVALVGPDRLGPAHRDQLAARLSASNSLGHRWAIGIEGPCPGFEPAALGDPAASADLAIYLGGPEHAVETIAALAETGTRAVIAASASYDAWPEDTIAAALEAGRRHTLRLVGPGSLGVRVPGVGLDASLMAHSARPGDLALVARSGALVNATLAWADAHGLGLSGVVSLGQKADVDVGDLVDWFAVDGRTRAILVHIETISDPRKFMSAARAAARVKPVVVLRSGVTRDLPRPLKSLCDALAPSDRIYDAAFDRAGLVRVFDIDEVFEAAETLTRFKAPNGSRLGVVANGRSLASLAADRLAAGNGQLSVPGEETCTALAPLVRRHVAPGNPAVLEDDADPQTFASAIAAFLADRETNGVLVAAAPTAVAPVAPLVDVLIDAATAHRKQALRPKPILAVLLDLAQEDALRLSEAGVLVRGSPGAAVRSFLHLVGYARGQEQLASTPPAGPERAHPARDTAPTVIGAALSAGLSELSEPDTRTLLSSFGLDMVERVRARTPQETFEAARAMLEVASCCRIGPETERGHSTQLAVEVASAVGAERLASFILSGGATASSAPVPQAVVLEPALSSEDTTALVAGIVDDPDFGPALVLAYSGASAASAPVAAALPPLDLRLADEMLATLGLELPGDVEAPDTDRGALCLALVRLAQLAVECPDVRAVDLAPILVGGGQARVGDARVQIAPAETAPGRLGHPRLSIRPFPSEWVRNLTLRDGRVFEIRPIRPEDEPAYKAFLESIDPEDLRLRFFAPLRHIGHAMLARLTQLDYARAIAFVAHDPETGEIQGSVRLHADPDHRVGEYAILLRSDLKGQGLGWALMSLIIEYARADGLEEIVGEVLRENTTMISLCEALGFTVKRVPDDEGLVEVHLPVATTTVSFHADLRKPHS
ncbi:bifunctional acetate--CoA ligase family protein/GNAT family N-acetyltransferase [Amorphus orientalis]|uniref:Acetyltransferase n=1 Tax=Amorphus orientalis TaxID=649198 RepID=A0AAE4ATG6_9HYPH|nr:bifunctional acetate--CoA ligase family protein/GNAT family N-acetyltransferase [Amorphus orientalis]MDQ0317261.1 acetyltransferase [Amorphus orientalis]